MAFGNELQWRMQARSLEGQLKAGADAELTEEVGEEGEEAEEGGERWPPAQTWALRTRLV